MFSKGDYVRIKMAPQTRMGTIEGSITKSNGREKPGAARCEKIS
jgi:hypothetical protein